jgi:hypothetical protein
VEVLEHLDKDLMEVMAQDSTGITPPPVAAGLVVWVAMVTTTLPRVMVELVYSLL